MTGAVASRRDVVGRYALYGALAKGGMATVHLGRLRGSAGFERTVAIKRLHPQFAADPEFVAMFLEEARLAGRIRHPNVVPVIDVVSDESGVLLVMEYVHGESLSRALRLSKRPIPIDVVRAIACDVLAGLHAAHEATDERGVPLDIVHRDISPQNIMIGADGIARLLDFGIAKASGRTQQTREGILKGKLSYMAPEQLTGGRTSSMSDINAVGIVLWEVLTGRRLFARENEGETVTAIMTATLVPPSTVRAEAASLDDAVGRALAKDPQDRFPTALEMAIAIAASGPKAGAHEVAAWLRETAGTQLEERAHAVADVEADGSSPSIDALDINVATRVAMTSDFEHDPPPASRSHSPKTIALVVGVALVAAGAWLLRSNDRTIPASQAAVGAEVARPAAPTPAALEPPSAPPSASASAAAASSTSATDTGAKAKPPTTTATPTQTPRSGRTVAPAPAGARAASGRGAAHAPGSSASGDEMPDHL